MGVTIVCDTPTHAPPYLRVQDPHDDDQDDYRVLPSDNMLVIGRAEEDFSSIEVHGKVMWEELQLHFNLHMGYIFSP